MPSRGWNRRVTSLKVPEASSHHKDFKTFLDGRQCRESDTNLSHHPGDDELFLTGRLHRLHEFLVVPSVDLAGTGDVGRIGGKLSFSSGINGPSATSGKAGGLKYVNRSKRLLTNGHLKGGGSLPKTSSIDQSDDLLFPVFNILADSFFISTDCTDMISSGPKLLPSKIFSQTILSQYESQFSL